jgi:hypothetical protein
VRAKVIEDATHVAEHAVHVDKGGHFATREQPELFERTVDNVVEQSRTLGVDYPIAVDSDYGVWRAFANHFWPAVYIADAEGRIRHHHFRRGQVRHDRNGDPADPARCRRTTSNQEGPSGDDSPAAPPACDV